MPDFHDFLALIEDAKDGVAGLAARALAQDFEHALKPFHLHFGFLAVLFEAGTKLFGRGSLGHLRQCLQDLPFGVVDVLEGVEKEIVQLLVSHVVVSRI